MSRYQIWDKTSNVITPTGKVFTPAEWIKKFPMGGIDGIKLVIGGGTINGSVCMEFNSTVEMYEKQGCDFSDCTTDQEKLNKIEEFEDAQSSAQSEVVSTDERIAAALEAQLMLQMTDEDTDDETDDETVSE